MLNGELVSFASKKSWTWRINPVDTARQALWMHVLCCFCKRTCIKVLRALMGFNGPKQPHLGPCTHELCFSSAWVHPSLLEVGCRFTSLQLRLHCSHAWAWPYALLTLTLTPEQKSEPGHPGATSGAGCPHWAWCWLPPRWSLPIPIPWGVSDARGWGCPPPALLLAGGCDRPWLPGPAWPVASSPWAAASPAWGSSGPVLCPDSSTSSLSKSWLSWGVP